MGGEVYKGQNDEQGKEAIHEIAKIMKWVIQNLFLSDPDIQNVLRFGKQCGQGQIQPVAVGKITGCDGTCAIGQAGESKHIIKIVISVHIQVPNAMEQGKQDDD